MTAARRFVGATVFAVAALLAILFLFAPNSYSELVGPVVEWLYELIRSAIAAAFETPSP